MLTIHTKRSCEYKNEYSKLYVGLSTLDPELSNPTRLGLVTQDQTHLIQVVHRLTIDGKCKLSEPDPIRSSVVFPVYKSDSNQPI